METAMERAQYGEAAPTPVTHNLRARSWKQYDGSGVVTVADYDFKGNLLSSSRQLVATYNATIDWQNSPANYLDPFTTATEYDALNRPTLVTLRNGNQIRPSYNRAGLLEQLEAAPLGGAFSAYVTNIDYDAKARREKIQYGNSVETDYTYDPLTFRLTHILSTRPNDPNPLQDLSYAYDPVGNIVQIGDAAQRTIFFNNTVVTPTAQYTYDAIYRLTQATGREHIGQSGSIVRPTDVDTWLVNNLPEPNDPQAMRLYTESYQYDGVGNILSVNHQAGNNGWTRRYQYADNSNRLSATTDDNDQFTLQYPHDEVGNINAMSHLPTIEWDFANRMVHANRGGSGDVYYYFTYDATGQRVRKVVTDEHGNVKSERIYHGTYETYREYSGGDLSLERESLHILDDQGRVALLETKTFDGGVIESPTPLPRYQLDNHLGSACLELDDQARVISYEEYHPYGTTAYRSTASGAETSTRRYRFTGKERDEETGFYYHGARYYSSWLGRWVSADPIAGADGADLNAYSYVHARVVISNDPTGLQDNQEPNQNPSGGATRPDMGVPPDDWEAQAFVANFENLLREFDTSLRELNEAWDKELFAYRISFIPENDRPIQDRPNYPYFSHPDTTFRKLEDTSAQVWNTIAQIVIGTTVGIFTIEVGGPLFALSPEFGKHIGEGDFAAAAIDIAMAAPALLTAGAARFTLVRGGGAALEEAEEVFFRTMTEAHAEELAATGKLPATSETFISPTRAFSEDYTGALVEFRVRAGTAAELASVGERDAARFTRLHFPDMPAASTGWATRGAYFKTERLLGVEQINIGLGRGKALDIFNRNIRSFNVLRR